MVQYNHHTSYKTTAFFCFREFAVVLCLTRTPSVVQARSCRLAVWAAAVTSLRAAFDWFVCEQIKGEHVDFVKAVQEL